MHLGHERGDGGLEPATVRLFTSLVCHCMNYVRIFRARALLELQIVPRRGGGSEYQNADFEYTLLLIKLIINIKILILCTGNTEVYVQRWLAATSRASPG